MQAEQLPLRDIHLPEPISFLWPLAPGWWLSFACLVVLILVSMWILRIRKRNAPKRFALRNLKKLEKAYSDNPKKLVQELSILLRRFYITKYPRHEVASLTGDTWLKFLDNHLDKPVFTRGKGRCLVDAPYRQNVEFDVEALLKLCRVLIKKGQTHDSF